MICFEFFVRAAYKYDLIAGIQSIYPSVKTPTAK